MSLVTAQGFFCWFLLTDMMSLNNSLVIWLVRYTPVQIWHIFNVRDYQNRTWFGIDKQQSFSASCHDWWCHHEQSNKYATFACFHLIDLMGVLHRIPAEILWRNWADTTDSRYATESNAFLAQQCEFICSNRLMVVIDIETLRCQCL